MPKRSLRQQMLIRRSAISSAENSVASLNVQKRFLSLPEYNSAKIVGLYAAFGNEIETVTLLRHALSQGKSVVYPSVVERSLVFRQVKDLSDMNTGYGGILEPSAKCTEVMVESIDVVVVPGIVFDMYGRRIGFGKGYYDKTFHRLEGAGRLIGFCHDFQLVAEIIGEEHDVTMDMIVTDMRLLRLRG